MRRHHRECRRRVAGGAQRLEWALDGEQHVLFGRRPADTLQVNLDGELSKARAWTTRSFGIRVSKKLVCVSVRECVRGARAYT